MKIDKGIKMPPNGCGRKYKHPFGEMEVGDSFLIAQVKGKTIRQLWSRAGSAMSYANRKLAPKRFSCRSVEGGIRIWRVA